MTEFFNQALVQTLDVYVDKAYQGNKDPLNGRM